MSNIRDTDLLLVNRNGTSFHCAKQDIDNVSDSDLFLINRSGVSFQCSKANVSANVRDDDAVLVNRSGVSYQATGADFKGIFESNYEETRPEGWVAGPVFAGAQFIDSADGDGVVIAIDGRSTGNTTDIVGSGDQFTIIDNFTGLARVRKSGVAYGNGRFVITVYNVKDNFSPMTYMSTDAGATWTAGNHPTGIPDPGTNYNRVIGTSGITYHPGLNQFIMMLTAETLNYVCRSTDGLSWTAESNSNIGPTVFIDYVRNKLYSEYLSATNRFLRYSTDATTWTPLSGFTQGRGISHGDGFFSAFGNDNPATIYQSSDGISWSAVGTAPTGKNVFGAGYGGGWSMAISTGTTDIIASKDGIDWEVIPGLSQYGRTINYSEELNKWHIFGVDGLTLHTDKTQAQS